MPPAKKTGMVTIQAAYIFFIPKKMTEHPSPAEPAGIFKFESLLLLKVNVNKNNTRIIYFDSKYAGLSKRIKINGLQMVMSLFRPGSFL